MIIKTDQKCTGINCFYRYAFHSLQLVFSIAETNKAVYSIHLL